MKTRTLVWLGVAVLGAAAVGGIALRRGESINSLWFVVAALCVYAIGFRFYSKWIAAKVMMLDDRRATPCEVKEDGHDFVKTNKWVVFGHHFAAIAGPGPLVGPVLAAQFGYLPGMLWMLIGATLGGAVHDSVILFCSIRRRGKSLGQMVREEVGPFAGVIALVSIVGPVEALRQAGISKAKFYNFTPYIGAAILFLCISIPLTRFTDQLLARERRRMQGTAVR